MFKPLAISNAFPLYLNASHQRFTPFSFGMVEGPMPLGGGSSRKSIDPLQVRENVLEYLKEKYPLLAQKKISETSYFISDSNSEIVHKIVSGYESKGFSQNSLDKATRDANKHFFKDKVAGEHIQDLSTTFISKENISEECRTQQYFDSTLILTIIHEAFHSLGSLPDTYKSFNLNWLEEGFCELLALEVHKSLYEKKYGVPAETYQYSYRAVKSLTDGKSSGIAIPLETLFECFTAHSVEPLISAFQSKGFTSAQIIGMFEAGARIDDHDNAGKGFKEFHKALVRTSVSHYAKELHKKECAQLFVNALWRLAVLEYEISSSKTPQIVHLDESSIKVKPVELAQLLSLGMCYAQGENKIYVSPKAQDQRLLLSTLAKSTFDAYSEAAFNLSKKKLQQPGEKECFNALYFHFIGKLAPEVVTAFSETERKYLALGARIVSILGERPAKEWVFNARGSSNPFASAFGNKAELLNADMVFFDEATTSFAMLLSAIEQLPSMQHELPEGNFGVQVRFGDFKKAFSDDAYAATLDLVSNMFPENNDESKSALASTILYFSHTCKSFSAESVALAALALRDSQIPGIYGTDIFNLDTSHEHPAITVGAYLNNIVVSNIADGQPLFKSIETLKLFNDAYDAFAKTGEHVRRDDGMRPLYPLLFRDLSEKLDGRGISRFEAGSSIYEHDAALKKKMENYVAKLDKEFDTKVYTRLYASQDFQKRYNRFVEHMIRNFILATAYETSSQREAFSNVGIVGKVLYGDIHGGIRIPLKDESKPEDNDLKVVVGAGGYMLQAGRETTATMFRDYKHALSQAITNKANISKLTNDLLLVDTSTYHTRQTEAWIRNALSNTKMAHDFFDMAQSGIESCASRIFISL